MCIDYNHLIGTLLEFISNSWNDIKASEYSNNTIFRTYCCGKGKAYRLEIINII